MGYASSYRLEGLRARGAPKPEFDPNPIFQSLINLTSGGHTGGLYSDLERFWDAFGFVGDGFLKKFFFDRKKIIFSEIFEISKKIWILGEKHFP